MSTRPDASADLLLVRRVLLGEADAVEVFLGRMACVRRGLSAKNAAFGRPFDAESLEDLIQDTLIAIWRKLATYEGRASLESWAYRFAYLELLTRLRTLRRQPVSLDAMTGSVDPEVPGVDSALVEHVYVMLDRLGPPDADVIRLKHLEGLTFDEVAVRTATSANTAKSRYYRGLRKLRGLMGLGEASATRERTA